MTTIRIIATVLITIWSSAVFAQYTGGPGRGDHMSQSEPLILSIKQHNINTLKYLNLFPVPAAQTINIQTNHTAKPLTIESIHIYDQWGKKINSLPGHSKQIPVHNLPAGLYLVRFVFQSVKPQTFKIMVARS